MASSRLWFAMDHWRALPSIGLAMAASGFPNERKLARASHLLNEIMNRMGRRIGPEEFSILVTRLGEALDDAGLPPAITVRDTEKPLTKYVDLFDPETEQEHTFRFQFLSAPKHSGKRVIVNSLQQYLRWLDQFSNEKAIPPDKRTKPMTKKRSHDCLVKVETKGEPLSGSIDALKMEPFDIRR